MDKRFTILYVDDEVSNLNIFKNTFRRDYNIFTAESAKEGLEILDREPIDLILTDQRMPEMTGVDFLKNVMQKYPEPSRILITAYTDFNALREAVNEAKIFQYIQKPWDEEDIKMTIEKALEIYHLRKKNLELTWELSKSNEELVRLNDELIELDKIKLQFLQIIGHEIRTPLNGLLGATSLFKSAFEKEEFLKYQQLFEMLEVSAERLAGFLLITEQITAFKTKRYKLNPLVINLNNLINEAVKDIKNKLLEKNIGVKLDLCTSDKCNCYAEQALVNICLFEILDNAIKYSDENGIITIRSYIQDDDFLIEINDTGAGFSPDVLKNIFKPFITDSEISKQGMGLNLALIKLIMEAHTGNIKILNNENRGARVQLIFKLFKS